ncbi:hypothetical protein CIPAW_03G025200 [Carya illinoinensis]|uniref:Uncharacterized protein n=1 Tax=Carya illinoinensis TaxID=32201 RepID=A0A8T1QYJ4_CARIL|nr:hypothetical protein CIPAW_03G025200 [Carya illinoinensis]
MFYICMSRMKNNHSAKDVSTNLINSLKSNLPSLFSSYVLIILLQFTTSFPSSKPKIQRTLCNSLPSIYPSLFSSKTSKASFNSSKLGSFSSNSPETSLELNLSRSSSPSELQKIPKLCMTVSASPLLKMLSSFFLLVLVCCWLSSKSEFFFSSQAFGLPKLGWYWREDQNLVKKLCILLRQMVVVWVKRTSSGK